MNAPLFSMESLIAARPARSMDEGYEAFVRKWCEANAKNRALLAAQKEDGTLELNMLDVIGYDWWTGGGITADTVKAKLDSNKGFDKIHVLMNSPGGDAFEGLAIQSLLRRTGVPVSFEILGLAASAATVISMAGDEVKIHEGAMFMVHEAWTLTWGKKKDIYATADFLAKLDSSMIDLYVRGTGRTREEIVSLVEAETWMTAHEAVENKFVTAVIPAKSNEDKSGSAKSGKARSMAQNTPPDPALLPQARTIQLSERDVPEGINGAELTDAELAIAATAARDAVAQHRSNEQQTYFQNHPLAAAAKRPAPPFGGMRNK